MCAGSGCNARGLGRDHRREGRMVGGAESWSGEWVGGLGVARRALRAVVWEWNRRGPPTALTPAFLQRFGARSAGDLLEGVYFGRFSLCQDIALLVFRIAADGDPAAVEIVESVGVELGEMAAGVIRQLELAGEPVEVVMIGSLFDGHALIQERMRETVHAVAPLARMVRLREPPVAGGVLLGMHITGHPVTPRVRESVLKSASSLCLGARRSASS